jgi:hypothetical protein
MLPEREATREFYQAARGPSQDPPEIHFHRHLEIAPGSVEALARLGAIHADAQDSDLNRKPLDFVSQPPAVARQCPIQLIRAGSA